MGAFREYADHDATRLAALLRAGEVSREGVLRAAIARAEALEPRLSAFAHLDPAGARAAGAEVHAEAPPLAGSALRADDEGLPIGMQFAAACSDDLLLPRLAARLEAETGWIDRRPPLAGAAP